MSLMCKEFEDRVRLSCSNVALISIKLLPIFHDSILFFSDCNKHLLEREVLGNLHSYISKGINWWITVCKKLVVAYTPKHQNTWKWKSTSKEQLPRWSCCPYNISCLLNFKIKTPIHMWTRHAWALTKTLLTQKSHLEPKQPKEDWLQSNVFTPRTHVTAKCTAW